MTSPDGIAWTARAAAEANLWESIAYGNGLFVSETNKGTIQQPWKRYIKHLKEKK